MMLCCCRKGKNTSYALGESNKDANLNTSIAENADNAKIQTGKGALSSSNQSIGPEAELDKGTVAATQQQRQSAPVTEQPVTPASSSPQNHQQPPKVVSVPPVNASQIQPQVEVSLKSSSSTKVVEEDKKVGSSSSSSNIVESSSQSVQHSTTIKVESSSKKNHNNKIEENLKQELDSIELAITEAEQGNSSPRELKSSLIPQLASQLQALTLQVTEAGQGHRMADLQSAVSRLEAVASRLESLAAKGGGGGGASADEVAPFVIEYDAILNGPLAEYLKVSNDIGGDVKTHSAMVKGTFDAVRDFLVVASKSKKPSQDAMVELVKPVGAKVVAVQEYRESNRRSEFFNHLSTISESITACGWISVTPTPAPYVKDALESGTFYSNRVLKDFKEKDPRHVQWTKSWTNVIKELQQYVKSNHTTGVTWNPQGVDAMSCAASAAPAPAVGGPPPPPPPPPPGPPPPPVSDAPSGPDDSAKNALFASINQGDNVTQGLRKVTDNMKTHKNPALRQGPAPFKAASPKPTPAAKPVVASKAVSVVKPPVLEKQGKKWVIEYQKDNKNISIDGDIKETLYAYKCEGSVIQVKGKINSVVLDSCKKTAVVLDDVLSSVEFVNCQSVQGQVTGKVNTLSIDKTDGCQFYLSKSSMNAEIVSAKSSEMNVLIPMDDGDFKEFALPEQYKTKYNGTTMVTTAAESI